MGTTAEIAPRLFPAKEDIKNPKINVPFYSNRDADFIRDLILDFQTNLGAKVYPGRCRASIVDMMRMLAGDFDAMVDVRAMRADKGAALKPWDVCGMIPFFEGLGWHVSDEKGRPVAWTDYRKPICLVVSRSHKLARSILSSLEKIAYPASRRTRARRPASGLSKSLNSTRQPGHRRLHYRMNGNEAI